jgi:2-dehydro-3-deoxygluconokinase
MRILSIGECMVEMAPAQTAGQFQMSFAGDTLNTAWYLHRAQPQWTVDYLTAIGTDNASQNMVQFLNAEGLGIDDLIEVPERTVGLYMIELSNGERSFSYWRSQSAARLLAADKTALEQRLLNRDMIYFSGITLAILEGEGRENLLAALATARSNGAQIVFDPNLRPKLWADTKTMCELITRAAEVSDVVLPSHDDEAAFFGDAGPQATIERYLEAGATTVIGKNGAGEILYSHDGVAGTIHPKPVNKIVDTTAAGDSFNAGFIAKFPDGDIEGAILAGCDLAGKVICGRGALVRV